MIEINQLNGNEHFNIPTPLYVIFGHTHQPTPWGSEDAPDTSEFGPPEMEPVTLFNTGGWLLGKNDKKEEVFCGAEVFTYDTAKGFSSVSIR